LKIPKKINLLKLFLIKKNLSPKFKKHHGKWKIFIEEIYYYYYYLFIYLFILQRSSTFI